MPQLAAAVKSAAVVWAAFAKAHAVLAFVVQVVASVAVTHVLGRILAPKAGLGGGALGSGSPLQLSRDPAASRRVIYGETRVSGPLLDGYVAGANNEYLHAVVALAGHECDSIGNVYFNDETVTLDGSGNATGTFAGFARVKKFLGVTGQSADGDFVADSGGTRASTDKFDRITGLYARLKWDQSKWPGGLPNLSAVVKGRKCYDPRTTITTWTANPALCVRDYLTNAQFGLAVDASEIDDASFIAAANICDEAVALAAGGTEPRYRCNGSFELSAEPATVLDKLLESMTGALVYVGGQWVCYAGAHATPESSRLTENDLTAPITVQTKASLRDTSNRVRGTFSSPDEKWQPADFVPIVNSLYLAEDGGVEIWRDLNFAFVTSHSQAQRLAKIELERTRQDISFSAACKLTALRYKPGDVVPVDNAELGWSGKLFVVTALKFSTYDVQGELALGVELRLRETAAEVWDWNSGLETTYDPAVNTTLWNPRTVPAVAGLTVTPVTDPAELTAPPRMRLTWTLPADQFVLSGGRTEWRHKKAAATDWLEGGSVDGNINLAYATDLETGVSTQFSARHVNRAGVPGPWSAAASAVPAPGRTEQQLTSTDAAVRALIDSVALDMAQFVASANDHAAALLQEFTRRQSDITAEASTRAQAIIDEATARGNAITTEQTVRANADTAETNARTTADSILQSDINTRATAASLTTEQNTRAAADTAETNARTTADSALQTNIDSVSSSLATEQTTRVSQDEALARDLSAMLAVFNDSVASLYQEFQVRAAADTSHSSSITTLNANVGSLQSTVNILSAAYIVGGVAVATWGFKLNAAGKVVSMQAIAASGGAQAETGVIVFAGADLRSDNFVAGTSGWFIGNTGNVEFQNGIFRGTLAAGSTIGAGVIADAPFPNYSTPGTPNITVNAPASPPAGYSVRYQVGTSNWLTASTFPFTVTMPNATTFLNLEATATGRLPSGIESNSWNSLFV